MNIFKKIAHGMRVAAVWVSKAFVGLFGKKQSEDFAKAALGILKSNFGKVVMTIVTSLATADLTKEQKRSQAFTQVKNAAQAAGVDVRDSIANLLVELAVSAIKQNFGEQQ